MLPFQDPRSATMPFHGDPMLPTGGLGSTLASGPKVGLRAGTPSPASPPSPYAPSLMDVQW